jgi:MSHA biogenesis protein MshM
MYLQHFGLQSYPFSLTPDTQFYCALENHQNAYEVLMYGIKHHEPFIKIVGEVGAGKTLLCRRLLNELESEEFVTAYIQNPDLSSMGLKRAFALELKIAESECRDDATLSSSITQKLIELSLANKRVVLIVDEAQAMPLETMESLRLLTNLETEKNKLLQVILFGQPELDTQLNQKQCRQINQRITFSYYLSSLNRFAVRSYLEHRLTTAGVSKKVFTKGAMALLYKASGGIPRVINILAHKALIISYGKGLTRVSARAVRLAIYDSLRIVKGWSLMNPSVMVGLLVHKIRGFV